MVPDRAQYSLYTRLTKGANLLKRLSAVALVTGILLAGSVMVAGAAGPGAEVDPAGGTVTGTVSTMLKACAGEDGGPVGSYVRVTQKLSGTSTDAFDGSGTPGDFSLTGTLSATAFLTINTASGQGWGSGMLTVVNGAGFTISGPVTVVVQVTDSSFDIIARGLWVGHVANPAGSRTGDLSIQNFELSGNTTSFSGSFGGSASVPDLSVKTSNIRC